MYLEGLRSLYDAIGAARIEKMRHGEEDTHRRILAARPHAPVLGEGTAVAFCRTSS